MKWFPWTVVRKDSWDDLESRFDNTAKSLGQVFVELGEEKKKSANLQESVRGLRDSSFKKSDGKSKTLEDYQIIGFSETREFFGGQFHSIEAIVQIRGYSHGEWNEFVDFRGLKWIVTVIEVPPLNQRRVEFEDGDLYMRLKALSSEQK